MIIMGGENIYSGEIEAIIHRYSGVLAQFSGHGITEWGELPVAFVLLMLGRAFSATEPAGLSEIGDSAKAPIPQRLPDPPRRAPPSAVLRPTA
jgi:acyl-CoA synthetase (AMP-forming)/AMP-acid ligase II